MLKKILDVSKLVTNKALDTKIEKVQNEISDVSRLFTNNALDTKIGEVGNNK